MTTIVVNLAAYRAAGAVTASPLSREAGAVPVDEAIAICLDHPEILTAWKAHFLVSIRRSCRELSPKQRAVLQRLFEKAWSVAEPDDGS